MVTFVHAFCAADSSRAQGIIDDHLSVEWKVCSRFANRVERKVLCLLLGPEERMEKTTSGEIDVLA